MEKRGISAVFYLLVVAGIGAVLFFMGVPKAIDYYHYSYDQPKSIDGTIEFSYPKVTVAIQQGGEKRLIEVETGDEQMRNLPFGSPVKVLYLKSDFSDAHFEKKNEKFMLFFLFFAALCCLFTFFKMLTELVTTGKITVSEDD